MKHSILIFFSILMLNSAQSRFVSPSEIRSFSKNFHCSNEKLQWQFDHLISLWDENEKAKSVGNKSYKIVSEASDVGGDEDWLYRGVTNNQFNESQILSVLFNDTTSVSESRWLTKSIFEKASINDSTLLVRNRALFKEKKFDEKWDLFKSAYLEVSQNIETLLNKSQFDEHVKIGSSYNSTPQAINFLTPHYKYASGYGEYLVHVREVVKRGIDVERYNAQKYNYSIGSIYSMDRDEYMVPSHIPSWDIQKIEVRNGSGWHQVNYGKLHYKFIKLYEPFNPCNVTGVRVDDSSNNPIGMLLVCKEKDPARCVSNWNHIKLDIDSTDRLKSTVSETKIDGNPIYFTSFASLESATKEVVLSLTPLFIYTQKQELNSKLLSNTPLWKEYFENQMINDPKYSLLILELLKDKVEILEFLKKNEDFKHQLKSKLKSISFTDFEDFINLMDLLQVTFDSSEDIKKLMIDFFDSPQTRMETLKIAQTYASTKLPLWVSIKNTMIEKLEKIKDLTPQEEFLADLSLYNDLEKDSTLSRFANLIVNDKKVASNFSSLLKLSLEKQLILLSNTFNKIILNSKQYPADSLMNFLINIGLNYRNVKGYENALGIAIDYDLSQNKLSVLKMLDYLKDMGLPKDREVDVLRSLWTNIKYDPSASLGNYLEKDLPEDLYEPLKKKILNDNTLTNEEKADKSDVLANSFRLFYLELITNSQPVVGMSVIKALDQYFDFDFLKTLSNLEVRKYDINDQIISVSSAEVLTTIASSLSYSYFLDMIENHSNKKESIKRQQSKKNIENFVRITSDYIRNQLSSDLKNPYIKLLFKNRYIQNKNENILQFCALLETLSEEPSKKAQFKKVMNEIQIAIPEMTIDTEDLPTDDSLGRYWKLLIKP